MGPYPFLSAHISPHTEATQTLLTLGAVVSLSWKMYVVDLSIQIFDSLCTTSSKMESPIFKMYFY